MSLGLILKGLYIYFRLEALHSFGFISSSDGHVDLEHPPPPPSTNNSRQFITVKLNIWIFCWQDGWVLNRWSVIYLKALSTKEIHRVASYILAISSGRKMITDVLKNSLFLQRLQSLSTETKLGGAQLCLYINQIILSSRITI